MDKNIKRLYIPGSFRNASLEKIGRVCNGCGPGNWKFDIVPDQIWGVNIKFACNIHDWMYHIGGSKKQRKFADRMFLHNIKYLLSINDSNLEWCQKTFGGFRAWLLYYGFVRLRGHKHFNFRRLKL